MDRWVAVGQSADADAFTAGRSAAEAAITGDAPALLVVFTSIDDGIEKLTEGITAATGGDVPVIGCSTAGEIASSGPGDGSVVVAAFGGPGFRAATAAGSIVDHDVQTASRAAAACMADLPPSEHQVLLLLSDGLCGDQQDVVRGAYSAVGSGVPLVGGCAGDGLRMERTFQIHGGEVLRSSVVGAALGSDSPMGIGVRHGWRRIGDPMLVTATDGNRVLALDDQPALDVYLQRTGTSAEGLDTESFTRLAMTHPLGVGRRSGEEVRFVAGTDFGDRSINCIAEVPQGGLVWIMEGDADSVLDATDAACGEAFAALDGRPPLGVLAFDCIARRGVLGEGIAQEIERIAGLAGGAPVAGFYTYGEIARTHGMTGFHNQTLVALALS